jgi:hypothetical protein
MVYYPVTVSQQQTVECTKFVKTRGKPVFWNAPAAKAMRMENYEV